jgi:hypothetical protein
MVAMKTKACTIQVAPAFIVEKELTPLIRRMEDQVVVGIHIDRHPMLAENQNVLVHEKRVLRWKWKMQSRTEAILARWNHDGCADTPTTSERIREYL